MIPPPPAPSPKKTHVMVLVSVMVLSCIMMLSCVSVLARVRVFSRVIMLAHDGLGTWVTRPEHLKGVKDEGPPRLLVSVYL